MLCLSLSQIASLAMFGRSSMLDVVNQDYIRTARAKGLDGRTVILKHALRNALIPVITLFSNFIPLLLGGSVIIEYLFGVPGMGRLSYDSIQNKDYNTVMALIYLDAIIVMLSILLSDMLYIIVDPRISFSKSEGGA
jgi:peptide/nickel transport system permease protein